MPSARKESAISYSLSELLTRIRVAVRDSFPLTYWVRAEVSSLSARPGSHCYMELAEKGADNQQFAAKVKANCWRSEWARVSATFEAIAGQPLKLGMQVLAEVSVEIHPVYGLSLVVHNIDPTFTLGDLARQKEEALKRLQEEGVADMQKALQLPTIPRRLAIVSAGSAAGYQDFVHQLTNNTFGFRFEVTLFEAIMQGDNAAASIIAALGDIMYDLMRHPGLYDAVVMIRGGGASTDLSCFDQYELAAHCAQFPLPIIAGIGHTRDVSLVDHVAFMSVKTPTAAAEFFLGLMLNQSSILDDLAQRLLRTADKQIQLRRNRLAQCEMRFEVAFRARLQEQQNALSLIEKTIALHSPERIFRKGYSLTTLNGRPVRSAAELHSGDVIRTELASGAIESAVI